MNLRCSLLRRLLWVENFISKRVSPTGDCIDIITTKDRRDTIGSLAVWYTVNFELKEVSDYTYEGFLRSMNAFEDSESLEQYLLVDLVAPLDRRFPQDFYTGLDEYIRDDYFLFTAKNFWSSKLGYHSDNISFEGLYLRNCDFFDGQPAYINRVYFRYYSSNSLFQNPPATGFDEQNEKFCEDILRIGDLLRDQYVDAFESYAIGKGYKHLLNLSLDIEDIDDI